MPVCPRGPALARSPLGEAEAEAHLFALRALSGPGGWAEGLEPHLANGDLGSEGFVAYLGPHGRCAAPEPTLRLRHLLCFPGPGPF